jgi:hypothetical protein
MSFSTRRPILLQVCKGSYVTVTGSLHRNGSLFTRDGKRLKPKDASARKSVLVVFASLMFWEEVGYRIPVSRVTHGIHTECL